MTRLAEILRTRRKELKIDDTDIAKYIGKSVRTYRYYEEDVTPPLETIKKLSEVLQFNVNDIYGSAKSLPKEEEKKPATEEEMTGMFLMLIEHLKNIGSNLSLTKSVAEENNSLIQTILLRMAEEKAPSVHEARKRFQGSLQVAEDFLKRNFSHIDLHKFENAGT